MSTKEVVAQKTIQWNIDNFTKEFAEKHSYKDFFKSEIISMRFKEEKSKWFLKVYPNGQIQGEEYRGHLAVFLYLESATTRDFDVKIEFQILKANGEVFKSESVDTKVMRKDKKFKDGVGTGKHKFIGHSELFDSHSMLSNNTLKLMCKLVISVPSSDSVPQDPSSGFLRDFCRLFEDTEISDVELKMSDRQVLKAHKIILMARSAVFRRMFSANMKEAANNAVDIPDFDSETMKELLRFIYCDEVQNLEKVSMKLIYCAEKYEMLELKKICCDHFIETMNAENMLEILEIADKVSEMETLMDECVEFLVTNWKDMKPGVCGKISPEVLVRIIDEKERREMHHVETHESSLSA